MKFPKTCLLIVLVTLGGPFSMTKPLGPGGAFTTTSVSCSPGTIEAGGPTLCTVAVTGLSEYASLYCVSFGQQSGGAQLYLRSVSCLPLSASGVAQLYEAAYNTGNATIHVGFPGDSQYAASSANFTLSVIKTSPSISTLLNGTGGWTPQPSYPIATSEASCVYYNSTVYCTGGVESGDVGVSPSYFAPFASDQVGGWESTTPYPVPLFAMGCASPPGYMVCVGGQGGTSLSSVSYFAPLSKDGVGSWKAGPSYPFPTQGISCVYYGGYVYCIGGDDQNTQSSYYASFSPSAGLGQWEPTAAYPIPNQNFGCSVSSGYVFCVGGSGHVWYEASPVADAYYAALSPSGIGQWLPTTSYPVPIDGHSCVALNDRMYCVGGESPIPRDYVYSAPMSSSGIGGWRADTNYTASVTGLSCVAGPFNVACIGEAGPGGAQDSVNILLPLSGTSQAAVGSSVYDSAALFGFDPDTYISSTVSYNIYHGAACYGAALSESVVNVTYGAIPRSQAHTFASSGLYSWQAVYSGDSNDKGAVSECEGLSVGGVALLSIATSALPTAELNVPYSANLSAAGGAPPYAWDVTSNGSALGRDGLSLSRSGILSGTPNTLGKVSFAVEVADSEGDTSSAELSLYTVAVSTSSSATSSVTVSTTRSTTFYTSQSTSPTTQVTASTSLTSTKLTSTSLTSTQSSSESTTIPEFQTSMVALGFISFLIAAYLIARSRLAPVNQRNRKPAENLASSGQRQSGPSTRTDPN